MDDIGLESHCGTVVLETTYDNLIMEQSGSGPKSGPISGDYDSVAQLHRQLIDELHAAYETLRRLDLATESRSRREAIGKLQGRLSGLMAGVDAIGVVD